MGEKEKFPLSVTQAKQSKQGSKPTNKTNKQASQSASERPHRPHLARSRRSFEVGTGDGHMEIDSNNSPQRNSSNCRRKERGRKKVGRLLVGSSWEVGNERKRERKRERERKRKGLVTGYWSLDWTDLVCL
jgi:hypothetical protein